MAFSSLITFRLQMAMIVIGGYAVATSRPVARLIVWMARVPKSPRVAIAFVTAVAMLTSYLNWAFSLVFTAILAREIARILPRVDYLALGAMAFVGLGTVWAQGLSGSAALQVASASSSPPPVQDVVREAGFASGTIPLSSTIFLWQSMLATLAVFVGAVAVAWLLAPAGDRARTAENLGVTIRPLIDTETNSEQGPRRGWSRRPARRSRWSVSYALLPSGRGAGNAAQSARPAGVLGATSGRFACRAGDVPWQRGQSPHRSTRGVPGDR